MDWLAIPKSDAPLAPPGTLGRMISSYRSSVTRELQGVTSHRFAVCFRMALRFSTPASD